MTSVNDNDKDSNVKFGDEVDDKDNDNKFVNEMTLIKMKSLRDDGKNDDNKAVLM